MIDTAATRHVIGNDTRHYAINVRPLDHPVTPYTANDIIMVYEQGDLAGANGTFINDLIVDTCSKSLYATIPACKDHNMGFNLEQGGKSTCFYRGNEIVLELECEGNLIVFPLEHSDNETALNLVP